MKKPSELGMNRTGIQASPMDSKDVIEMARKTSVAAVKNGEVLMRRRIELTKDAGMLGTVPVPASLKGAAATAKRMLKGEKASVLVDKLAERLAFERTGTRLYQALLSKFDGYGTWDGGPSRDDLLRFHDEELAHMEMLKEALDSIGADPTAMTPSADLTGVVSMGVLKAVTDARTDLRESLEAILVAELADNACWETLVDLARALGQDAMAARFESARAEEAQHLLSVRRWIRRAVSADAGADLEEELRPPTP